MHCYHCSQPITPDQECVYDQPFGDDDDPAYHLPCWQTAVEQEIER